MRYLKPFVYLLSTLFLFLSCDSSPTINNDSATGTLRVSLTDAPGDFEAVYIDIQEVKVHRSSDAEETDGEWIVINEEPVRVDLLDLVNGKLDVLGETELEAGNYQQLRLVLGNDNEIVVNGETISLDTPSAQQSGLKLNLDVSIEGGEIFNLLLDFDASRSIVKAGASGKFILKPVLRAVELEEAGAITGEITPSESLPWVYAIAEEDTVAGTKADETGSFTIIGLPSGTYQVSVEPSAEGFGSAVVPDVPVASRDTTDVGIIELEVTESSDTED